MEPFFPHQLLALHASNKHQQEDLGRLTPDVSDSLHNYSTFTGMEKV
jgi:hypothetical protein